MGHKLAVPPQSWKGLELCGLVLPCGRCCVVAARREPAVCSVHLAWFERSPQEPRGPRIRVSGPPVTPQRQVFAPASVPGCAAASL